MLRLGGGKPRNPSLLAELIGQEASITFVTQAELTK
jgi:hypothetical protein